MENVKNVKKKGKYLKTKNKKAENLLMSYHL